MKTSGLCGEGRNLAKVNVQMLTRAQLNAAQLLTKQLRQSPRRMIAERKVTQRAFRILLSITFAFAMVDMHNGNKVFSKRLQDCHLFTSHKPMIAGLSHADQKTCFPPESGSFDSRGWGWNMLANRAYGEYSYYIPLNPSDYKCQSHFSF